MKVVIEKKLEKIAIHYLARFACSVSTLRLFLIRKLEKIENNIEDADCVELIDLTLKKLQQLGFLNDFNYAEHVMYTLIAQGKSKKGIIYTMQKKGIPDVIIDELLASKLPEEKILAMTFAKKKCIGQFRNHSVKNFQKQYAKDIKTMLRQGFSLEIIYQVLNQ